MGRAPRKPNHRVPCKGEFLERPEPTVPLFGQESAEGARESRRNCAHFRKASGRVVQNRSCETSRVRAGERTRSREHLDGEDAKCPQIHPGVHVLATDKLLGSHIRERSGNRRVIEGRRLPDQERDLLLAQVAGEAEVRHHRTILVAEQDVLWLEIAMHQAFGLQLVQSDQHMR